MFWYKKPWLTWTNLKKWKAWIWWRLKISSPSKTAHQLIWVLGNVSFWQFNALTEAACSFVGLQLGWLWVYTWWGIHLLLLRGLNRASNGPRWKGHSVIWNTAANGLQMWTRGTCYKIRCTGNTPNDSKMMWAIKAEWSLPLRWTDGGLFLEWKHAPDCHYTERCAFAGLWELLWHLMFLCVKFSPPTPSWVSSFSS